MSMTDFLAETIDLPFLGSFSVKTFIILGIAIFFLWPLMPQILAAVIKFLLSLSPKIVAAVGAVVREVEARIHNTPIQPGPSIPMAPVPAAPPVTGAVLAADVGTALRDLQSLAAWAVTKGGPEVLARVTALYADLQKQAQSAPDVKEPK